MSAAALVDKSVQVSEMSDRPDSSSEPFYIFASISPPLSETEVIIPNLKPLDGKWKVALRELSFLRTGQPFARSQPLQFLIATPANCDEGFASYTFFLDNFKGIKNESFGKLEGRLDNIFPDFPYAAVVTAQNRDGTTVMLPCGRKPLENFIAETNEVLKNYFASHQGRIQFNGINIKEEADNIVISWDTAKGEWKEVHIFPIFNQDLGRILGLPTVSSSKFSTVVLNAMKDRANIIMPRNDIIESRTDFIIQCSIVEHNSNVSTAGAGEGGGEGLENSLNNRILRFVSQADLEKYSHSMSYETSFLSNFG